MLRPLPSVGLAEAGILGSVWCNLVLFACLFFSDQEHLDKEIERLRKQLKVKVNRFLRPKVLAWGLSLWPETRGEMV